MERTLIGCKIIFTHFLNGQQTTIHKHIFDKKISTDSIEWAETRKNMKQLINECDYINMYNAGTHTVSIVKDMGRKEGMFKIIPIYA